MYSLGPLDTTKRYLDTVSEMYAMSEITSVYDDAEQAFKVSLAKRLLVNIEKIS